MQCSTLGNMSVTPRIPNVAFLGLLVSLSLFSDLGFVTAEQIVDTEPHVVLEVGTKGILPCRIQRRAVSVEWKRQLSSETKLLVSLDPFFIVGERDGPGYEAGLFNITDDYSLVIKDVKVQDEGLYMCSFSDFQTGITFRNSTRVSVQAFPEEPFPVIQECIGKDVNSGACTLTIYSTSDLTCLVRGYYPDIDLFFLHGSEKMTSIEDEEWYNADGTNNRDITIQISVSDEPYECVASRLPVIGGNRSVTVIVQTSPQVHSQGPNAVAIVVPVIVGICLSIMTCIAAIFRYRRGNGRDWWSRHEYISVARGNTSTNQKDLGGPISKLELWLLIKYAEEKGDYEKLGKVVRRLLNSDALTLQTDLDFYESLCTWKRETPSHSNQRKILYSVLNEANMSDLIWKLQDFVIDSSREVSRAILGHILWEIKETSKITELLKSLQLNHQSVATAVEKGRREVVHRAHRELVEWQKGEFPINPLVILSLKLDDLECETNFFKIPSREMEYIDVCELKGRSFKFSRQHLTHLLKVYGGIHGEDVPYTIESLVQENHESLFDTIQMLQDWVQNEECSNYETRKKLRKGVEASLQRDQKVYKWPPDDELRAIASFLSPASMEHLFSELGIRSPPKEDSEEERFQTLAKWRDNFASSKDLQEKHTELFTALNKIKRGGLVPRVKGPLIYKVELVDLAFHLFTQDLLPFTEALCISAAKLVTYRAAFHPSHMTQGTIGLVCKLFESRGRSHLLKLVKEMPYANFYARAMLDLEISFEEVCNFSNRHANCQALERTRPSFTKSTSMPRGDHDSFKGIVVKKTSSVDEDKFISPGANPMHGDASYDEGTQEQYETATMLSLACQVENHNQVSPTSLDFLKHFKRWREQSRLSPFNFRLALAYCLRSEANYDQISAFLRGDCNKGIPFIFIYIILKEMNPEQRGTLGRLIREPKFVPVEFEWSASFFKEDCFELTDAVSKFVHEWAGKWIMEMTQSELKKGKSGFLATEIAEKHKDFNDKLVDSGFVDLAREIMTTERHS